MLIWLNNNIGFVAIIVGLIAAVVGVITAPIVAFRIQNYKEQKKRKFEIFKTLLATRANLTSLEHLQALNMIDIEYYEEENISQLLDIYRDHLNSYPQNQSKNAQNYWEEKRIDYLIDLLHDMSLFFGYDLDKVILKKGTTSWMSHGTLNIEQTLIRKGVAALLTGQKPMKIQFVNNPPKGSGIPNN